MLLIQYQNIMTGIILSLFKDLNISRLNGLIESKIKV